MASPQAENGFTRISNELYEQIIMRPFTKRQRSIIDLIVRLSYGCGSKRARIPKLSHFIVCGVDKYHIKPELITLQQKNVIGWDKDEREFWLNKDYDSWLLPKPDSAHIEQMRAMVGVSLAGYQNSNHKDESYQNGNQAIEESYQNGNSEVTKTVTNELPKRQPRPPKKPRGSKVDRVSKESIKEKVKEKIIIMPSAPILNDDQQQALNLLYELVSPEETDAKWIQQISSQYKNVNLAGTALALVTWLNGHPKDRDKPKANHRLRFLNFVKRDASRGNTNTAKSNPPRKRDEGEFDFDAARRLREQIAIQQQQRRGTDVAPVPNRETGSH